MKLEMLTNSAMFLEILTGIVITLISGIIAIRIAFRFGLVDIPGAAPHKKHRFPTPLAGGITLIIAVTVLTLIFGFYKLPWWLGTIAAAAIVFSFGVWDDRRMLPAWVKLIGQMAAAVILILSGISVQILEKLGDGILPGVVLVWLDYGITIFWVVMITNAFNLVDSMDGLVAGLTSSAFAAFMLAAMDSHQFELAGVCALMFGICFGLNYLNAPPARMFLGDSGAQTLGFLLAVIAILYNPLDRLQSSSWFVPILLVAVPMFDTALVTLSRLRRRTAFYKAGRDHTYHRLVAMGLDSNRAVMLMNLVAILLESLAFVTVMLSALHANLVFFATLLAGISALFVLDQRKVRVMVGLEPKPTESKVRPTDGAE